ncbi:hypothetical protein [Stenotrophomonas sp.]|uniref:hypothetical protein n=1 Tax=Stenotrophomonas sp. TaxID=69392 RepID=UPI0028AA52D7|nr:hypothetical protein [Stenotrophomonas sp.]
MIRPTGSLLKIVEYRDFYDVPRRILALDQGGAFWIFDSVFNDEIDDYEDHFTLYLAGQEPDQAKALFAQHCEGSYGQALLDLPVTEVLFDATKRASFVLS